jgi:protein CpxP
MYMERQSKQIDTKSCPWDTYPKHGLVKIASTLAGTGKRILIFHQQRGSTMNAMRKHLLSGLAVLALAGTTTLALAQAPAAEGRHGHAAKLEQMQEKRAAMFTAHMTKLHDALKLTAAQEAGWTTFVAAVTPAPRAAHPDHAAMATLSAPERLEKMIAMAKTHTAAMETKLAALKTFYTTLTPEQQKVFNDNSMGGAHGPHPFMQMMHKKQ